MSPLPFHAKHHCRFGNSRPASSLNLTDRSACRAKQGYNLGRSKQYAAHESDIAEPSREIVEFATEDQHTAGDRYGRKRDEPGDRTCNRLLDLLKWRFPWETAATR
jgi:hypothetical protein